MPATAETARSALFAGCWCMPRYASGCSGTAPAVVWFCAGASPLLRSGFLRMPSASAVTAPPVSSDSRNSHGWSMTGSRNRPPWGAGHIHPNRELIIPAAILPRQVLGITRSGSRRAKGSAPSVTKDAPRSRFWGAVRRSCSVNRSGNSIQAIATPMGGVIPPIITAAIISYWSFISASVPNR